jgi:hypothetical protein
MKPSLVILAFAAASCFAQVKITADSGRISVEMDGKPYGALYIGPSVQKPYFYPLRTASGRIITRMFPMENPPGESHDHRHHRGLWFTHGDVNGFDFWADSGPASKQGRVRLDKVAGVTSGDHEGSLHVLFDWVDPEGVVLLTEDRTMTFHTAPGLRILDFDATLTPKVAVKFGDTKEGTFAIRLSDSLKEDKGGTGRMVNASGAETEKNVWGKASPWVDYAGEVGGERVGIAIFDNPGNLKHPTFWHSRAYGLFAANPFGEHDFFNDKKRDGSVTLEPGQSRRFRYRVIIHPGDAASAGIAQLYQKYAAGN